MVEKLEMTLQAKGWTQSAFEKAAMLSENRISKWKGGKGEPTARQALRMARLLGMPVDFLIDDDQVGPPAAPPTEREKQVREIVREIGVDEAWRRLVRAPGAGAGAGATEYSAGEEVPGRDAGLKKGRAG